MSAELIAAERKKIAASLRRRGSSAMALATKGLLVTSEALRLRRWLNAAAQDVEAGLADDGDSSAA